MPSHYAISLILNYDLSEMLALYNDTGWLGIKRKVTYFLSEKYLPDLRAVYMTMSCNFKPTFMSAWYNHPGWMSVEKHVALHQRQCLAA